MFARRDAGAVANRAARRTSRRRSWWVFLPAGGQPTLCGDLAALAPRPATGAHARTLVRTPAVTQSRPSATVVAARSGRPRGSGGLISGWSGRSCGSLVPTVSRPESGQESVSGAERAESPRKASGRESGARRQLHPSAAGPDRGPELLFQIVAGELHPEEVDRGNTPTSPRRVVKRLAKESGCSTESSSAAAAVCAMRRRRSSKA